MAKSSAMGTVTVLMSKDGPVQKLDSFLDIPGRSPSKGSS